MISRCRVLVRPGLSEMSRFVREFAEEPCVEVPNCSAGIDASLHGLWNLNGPLGTFGDIGAGLGHLERVERAVGRVAGDDRRAEVLATAVCLTVCYFRRHVLLKSMLHYGSQGRAALAARRLLERLRKFAGQPLLVTLGAAPTRPVKSAALDTLIAFEGALEGLQQLENEVRAEPRWQAKADRGAPGETRLRSAMPFLREPRHRDRERVLLRLRGHFRRLGTNVVSLLVYGSTARGTARVQSDIDLLLTVRDSVREDKEHLTEILAEILSAHDLILGSGPFRRNDPLMYLFESEVRCINPFYRTDILDDAVPILGQRPIAPLGFGSSLYDRHMLRFGMMADFHAIRWQAARALLCREPGRLGRFAAFLRAHWDTIRRYAALGRYPGGQTWITLIGKMQGVVRAVGEEGPKVDDKNERRGNLEKFVCDFLDRYRDCIVVAYGIRQA